VQCSRKEKEVKKQRGKEEGEVREVQSVQEKEVIRL